MRFSKTFQEENNITKKLVEDVEKITELSSRKLGDYLANAKISVSTNSAGSERSDIKNDPKNKKKYDRKIYNRFLGMNRATSKLVNRAAMNEDQIEFELEILEALIEKYILNQEINDENI